MCDKDNFNGLERRVDALDTRLTAVETSVGSMRDEMRGGFAELKTALSDIYAERKEWSAWARDNLGRALKWIGVIVLVACGIAQSGNIIKAFAAAATN